MPLSETEILDLRRLISRAKAIEPERAYRGIHNDGAHDLLARNLEIQLEILDVLQDIKKEIRK